MPKDRAAERPYPSDTNANPSINVVLDGLQRTRGEQVGCVEAGPHYLHLVPTGCPVLCMSLSKLQIVRRRAPICARKEQEQIPHTAAVLLISRNE